MDLKLNTAAQKSKTESRCIQWLTHPKCPSPAGARDLVVPGGNFALRGSSTFSWRIEFRYLNERTGCKVIALYPVWGA